MTPEKTGYRLVPLPERPELLNAVDSLVGEAFPEIILHDPVWDAAWTHMVDDFAPLQFFLCAPDSDQVLGLLNSVPFRWDGTPADLPEGLHGVLRRSIEGRDAGIAPNALCAVQAAIGVTGRGRGLSRHLMVEGMRVAAGAGLDRFVSPIRPADMHRYPLTPIERYANWRDPQGRLLDWWLRFQEEKLGAELVDWCAESTVIDASVGEMERWSGMSFPDSGDYLVPGGFAPVRVDRENDRAQYRDPSVWFVYPVDQHRAER